MDFTQILGVTGAIIYLASYFLLQAGCIKGESNLYAGLNLLAAICVLTSLYTKFNIGSFLIQISFISLSLYGIARKFIAKRPTELSPEEKQLADILLPSLPYRRALVLIREGVIKTNLHGQLAKEGTPLDEISILIDGNAVVKKSGKKVATVSFGQIIGDVTCISGQPATAEVSTSGRATYFTIPTNILRKTLSQNNDILESFEQALRYQLTLKLA